MKTIRSWNTPRKRKTRSPFSNKKPKATPSQCEARPKRRCNGFRQIRPTPQAHLLPLSSGALQKRLAGRRAPRTFRACPGSGFRLNFSLASQELQLALQADPANPLALREMGADLLAQGNYELARRFYVRAVQANPTDKTAQGHLGCTLMRLGRVPEATSFLNRAGPGPWTGCTPVANPSATGAFPGQPATGSVPRP